MTARIINADNCRGAVACERTIAEFNEAVITDERRRVKCRFCSWSAPAWVTLKSGKRRSGMQRLLNHVEDYHDREHADIHDWLSQS